MATVGRGFDFGPGRYARLAGVFTAVVLAGCHGPRAKAPPGESSAPAEANFLQPAQSDELAGEATADPLAFLRKCREHYLQTIRDYRCTFHIQESEADGRLGPEQEIAIRFREQPFSVDMRWTKNPIRASRVNYVAGRWRQGGREHAWIQPSGLLALVTPAGVRLPIHAPEVRAASRRPVDDFGFRRTLELIIENCERGKGDPAFDLRCIGEGDIDGRPCIILRRLLPYAGSGGPYPDRRLDIYIDRQWLVPTGCFSFADEEGQKPIGRYVTTGVELNVGLTDEDF